MGYTRKTMVKAVKKHDFLVFLHSMKNYSATKKYIVRLCGSNGKMNLHGYFYVYARLKKFTKTTDVDMTQCMYIN